MINEEKYSKKIKSINAVINNKRIKIEFKE